MKFKKGDEVMVNHLKRTGTIISVSKSGKYTISVGPLSVESEESGISQLSEAQKKKLKVKNPLAKSKVQFEVPMVTDSLKSLDLHGFRVKEALDTLKDRLDQAIRADLDRLEIVHGVGEGKLLSAIHQFLKEVTYVSHFKLDENNPGVTYVYF
jgi:DNA mismatch repair protein MutS2